MATKIKSTNKDFVDRMISKLKRARPKSDEEGTFTVGRSSDTDSDSAINYVVTTGVRAFDDRVGGMPIGKTSEFFGSPASGKTQMAIRVCVRAQQGHVYKRIPTGKDTHRLEKLKPGTFDVTCLYYDNESALADPWMKVVDGVELDAIVEQCDTVDLLWKTMDMVVKDLAEEEEKTKRIQFLIIVVDTVASLCTKDDFKRDWGKRDFPRTPQQLKDGFRIMIRKLSRYNVMLIGNNHVSMIMEKARGVRAFRAWDYNAPGGQAFKYYAHHRIYFEQVKSKYRMHKKGEAAGLSIYFFSEKNRLRPPLREGRLALLFGTREDDGTVLEEGGFVDNYCLLETLIFSKAVNVSKGTGAMSFRFTAFGIKTTTFGENAAAPLEEQGKLDETENPEERKGRKEPSIPNRAAWAAFYAAHTADIDALYKECNDRCFNRSIKSLDELEGSGEDADEEDSSESEG